MVFTGGYSFLALGTFFGNVGPPNCLTDIVSKNSQAWKPPTASSSDDIDVVGPQVGVGLSRYLPRWVTQRGVQLLILLGIWLWCS